MLVLSRKRGEVIKLTPQGEIVLSPGDSIEITICEIRGGRVRVGIDAPRSLNVSRTEAGVSKKKDKACG